MTSIDQFLFIIQKFRKNYPDITISTDAIVGFPTETDDQFQKTVDLLKLVKPDITNITRYSARPYTKAKSMSGRIRTEIVKERSRNLTKLCNNISKHNNLKYNGKKYNILMTEKGKDNSYMGRTENYKPVVIKQNVKIGSVIPVEIIRSAQTYLVGSII